MPVPQDGSTDILPTKRPADAGTSSGSSTSDGSNSKRRRHNKSHSKKHSKSQGNTDGNDLPLLLNANGHSGLSRRRRSSLGKAARDPRDGPAVKKMVKLPDGVDRTRSPTPIINDDGLSRPGTITPMLPSFSHVPAHQIGDANATQLQLLALS